MRAQFAFYKSFDDVYQDLSDKQKLEFVNTLLDVQFLRVKIDDVSFKDNILKHIWNAQKHSLQKAINGYLESQKNTKIKNPYYGIYDPLLIPSEGVHKEEQVKEEEKEQVQSKKSEYDDFLEQLSKACKYKTKVTKTKEGAKIFKSILDKGKLFKDYIQHQIDKDNYATRITDFMKDYGTVHDSNITEEENYGY